MLEAPSAAQIRDELQDLVLHDLHGPLGGEFEEFTERPTDRYPLARLTPVGTTIEPDEQDETADGDAADPGEDRAEPTAPNIVSLAPSALGCTMYVTGDVTELRIRAEWARYDRVPGEGEHASGPVWRRVPVHGMARLTLADGALGEERLNAGHPQVVVRGRACRHEGNWLVSVFLVNTQPRPSRLPDAAWLFQVRLTVTGPAGTAVFLPRPSLVSGGDAADKAEQRRLAMAYRFHPEFAVGHSTGVHVVRSGDDPLRATEIHTASPRTRCPPPECRTRAAMRTCRSSRT
ncbi:MAG: hypothetical protein ACRDOO_24170 [Actinomadura sp.]